MTYFRVHPDPDNRDVFDDDSRLFDQNFSEVQPEVLSGNDVLIALTPDQYETIRAARK